MPISDIVLTMYTGHGVCLYIRGRWWKRERYRFPKLGPGTFFQAEL